MDRCTISGSEVFHRECVTRIEDSIGHRRQRQIHELTQALEQAGRTIRQAERATHQASRSAAAIDQLTTALARTETALAQAAADATIRQQRHSEEITKLRSERDIARAELAIAVAAHTPAPTPADNPEWDDAATRFSLLELDR